MDTALLYLQQVNKCVILMDGVKFEYNGIELYRYKNDSDFRVETVCQSAHVIIIFLNYNEIS